MNIFRIFRPKRSAEFDRMIGLAKDRGACESSIKDLEKYKTIEEALKDKEAPYWCYWYAKHVLNGRWDQSKYKMMEDRIMEDSQWSYYYEINVLNWE